MFQISRAGLLYALALTLAAGSAAAQGGVYTVAGTNPGGSGGYGGTVAGAIIIVLLQNVLQIVGVRPAGQQILYGLIILLMLFVYGRGMRVRE